MKIKVRWQVDDGYAGASRPQHTTFDTEDYCDDEEWESKSEEEKRQLIEEVVEEDFRNKASFHIDDYGI